jgi:hypothetical protein
MTAVLNTHPHAAQLLGLLGLPAQPLMQQLAGIGQQATLLRSLIDNFQRAAGGLSAGGLGQLATQGALPPAVQVAPPNPGACRCGGHYAPAQGGRVDLGTAPGVAPGTPAALQERLRGVQLERFLGANPFAKSQLEARLGGRILPDGLADGVLTVQRVPQGLLGGGAAGPVSPAQSALGGIQQGAAYAGLPAAGPGAFQNMMLGALANTLGGGGLLPGALPAAAAPLPAPGAAMRRPIGFDDILRPPPAFGGVPGGAAVGGVPGFGAAPMFGGGAPVMGAPGGGLGAAGGLPMAPAPAAGGKGGGLAGALNEPGLTVEDKVVMLLMQVTKGFDKQIQDQANHVNQLQQQQNGGGGKGGKGGGGKGGGGGGEASIDVESMKLKRLIDKRGQMFDMLRQIIDKYNETAKNMIQSVSR